MKIIKLITLILIVQIPTFGQITKAELNGNWITSNENHSFQISDTIKFIKINTINSISNNSCNQIIWQIKNKRFKSIKINNCSEPKQIIQNNQKKKIKIKKTDFGQVIEIYSNKDLIEKFRIITNHKQQKIKMKNNFNELKLMRFDKLKDERLYKYVDSLIYKVLKYNPDSFENVKYLNKKLKSNLNGKIKLRNNINKNPEPFIIINGYPINDKEILKKLLLVETYNIFCLTKEKSISLYGVRAVNGAIIMNTSEIRFKKIRKKHGW